MTKFFTNLVTLSRFDGYFRGVNHLAFTFLPNHWVRKAAFDVGVYRGMLHETNLQAKRFLELYSHLILRRDCLQRVGILLFYVEQTTSLIKFIKARQRRAT